MRRSHSLFSALIVISLCFVLGAACSDKDTTQPDTAIVTDAGADGPNPTSDGGADIAQEGFFPDSIVHPDGWFPGDAGDQYDPC
jgi:hypothetical protein